MSMEKESVSSPKIRGSTLSFDKTVFVYIQNYKQLLLLCHQHKVMSNNCAARSAGSTCCHSWAVWGKSWPEQMTEWLNKSAKYSSLRDPNQCFTGAARLYYDQMKINCEPRPWKLNQSSQFDSKGPKIFHIFFIYFSNFWQIFTYIFWVFVVHTYPRSGNHIAPFGFPGTNNIPAGFY